MAGAFQSDAFQAGAWQMDTTPPSSTGGHGGKTKPRFMQYQSDPAEDMLIQLLREDEEMLVIIDG